MSLKTFQQLCGERRLETSVVCSRMQSHKTAARQATKRRSERRTVALDQAPITFQRRGGKGIDLGYVHAGLQIKIRVSKALQGCELRLRLIESGTAESGTAESGTAESGTAES